MRKVRERREERKRKHLASVRHMTKESKTMTGESEELLSGGNDCRLKDYGSTLLPHRSNNHHRPSFDGIDYDEEATLTECVRRFFLSFSKFLSLRAPRLGGIYD